MARQLSILDHNSSAHQRFRTIGAALRALPVHDLLFDERDELRTLVNVYVDGTDTRERGGLEAELEGGETIRVVAAIAGG